MLPAFIILWFITAVSNGIAAPIIGTARRGIKGFGIGCIVAFGWLCTGCILMASIGVLERTWSAWSVQVLLCSIAGLAGILMVCWGWRRILQRHVGPGHCASCGYPLETLHRCPECGLGKTVAQPRRAD